MRVRALKVITYKICSNLINLQNPLFCDIISVYSKEVDGHER